MSLFRHPVVLVRNRNLVPSRVTFQQLIVHRSLTLISTRAGASFSANRATLSSTMSGNLLLLLTLLWLFNRERRRATFNLQSKHKSNAKLKIRRTIPAQYIKFRRTFRRIIWEISPHKTAQFAFLDKCGAAQFAIFCRT